MSYIYYNPNPLKKSKNDCVVRGICRITGMSWHEVYWELCEQGSEMCDMPPVNSVWGKYLLENGFTKHTIPDICPNCYTVNRFCYDHPEGEYILAMGQHVIAVVDGDFYDTEDTGNEVPIYYYRKE